MIHNNSTGSEKMFVYNFVLQKYGLWKDSHDICKDMAQAEENMSQPASPKGNVNESAHTYDNELSTTVSIMLMNVHLNVCLCLHDCAHLHTFLLIFNLFRETYLQ